VCHAGYGAQFDVQAAPRRFLERSVTGHAADDDLNRARLEAGLSLDDLWLRNHDVIAPALNERFVELGRNHPVPYAAR
jgi:hypothetical protein